MKTIMKSPKESQSKKAVIERLNFVTAVISGALLAAISYYLAKKYLPENPDSQFIKTRNDQQVLIAMIGWFVGFMAGIGALIGPFRWAFGKDLNHHEM
jgi:cytochrome c oxidase subunit 1